MTNIRLKELANEAADWCRENAIGAPVAWEWEMKFGELIMQECVDQLDDLMNRTLNEFVELETLTGTVKLMDNDLVYRLRKRAEIRRQIPSRKSVQEGKSDRIADLLDEAAAEIERLKKVLDK